MRIHQLTMGLFIATATVIGSQSTALSTWQFNNPTHPTLSEVAQSRSAQVTQFKVRVENISAWNGQTASDGTQWTLDFSPGAWLVHRNNAPLFKTGKRDRGQGLEAIAEDGNPTQLAKSLQKQPEVLASGVFNTAVGANKVGGIRPEQAFEFTIQASPGEKLSFATMFGQSNDLFYSPADAGIALFDRQGNPVSGDVTDQVLLWDVGTEVNQEPGIGSEQGPRQKAVNTGKAENGVVRIVKDSFTYPQTGQVMRVIITPQT
ncbi:MAG: spondin domain-containing protein [Scytolyngbya sp. HA4215-MV1]|nr:spondin domain-containing protein [Scytolyngbya sp. HA4215-MV1]